MFNKYYLAQIHLKSFLTETALAVKPRKWINGKNLFSTIFRTIWKYLYEKIYVFIMNRKDFVCALDAILFRSCFHVFLKTANFVQVLFFLECFQMIFPYQNIIIFYCYIFNLTKICNIYYYISYYFHEIIFFIFWWLQMSFLAAIWNARPRTKHFKRNNFSFPNT